MRILAVLLLVSASASRVFAADDPVKVTDAEVRELRISELVSLIGVLGEGKTDVAMQKLEVMLPRPFAKSDEEPFGVKSRWSAALTPFQKSALKFESADVTGIQSVSVDAKLITIVANGKTGPVVFTFGMFRYGGKYRLGNLNFISDWNRFGLQIATIKERRTRVFPLKTNIATKNSTTGKN